MDFANSDGNLYQYSVNGGGWTTLPPKVTDLVLGQLSPGTYRISIRSVNGQTYSAERQVRVAIRPAWYASWWAFVAYVLIAVFAVWYYLRSRRRRQQAQLRLQEFIHQHESRQQQLQAVVHDYERQIGQLQARQKEDASKDKVAEAVDKTLPPQLPSADEQLLNKVIDIISRHVSDPELSVERVAEEVGMSRSQLYRKMKDITGQTTKELVSSIRLQRAARLLAQGGMPVADVMYSCGYSFASSFTTAFKKFYGVSPTEYQLKSGKAG